MAWVLPPRTFYPSSYPKVLVLLSPEYAEELFGLIQVGVNQQELLKKAQGELLPLYQQLFVPLGIPRETLAQRIMDEVAALYERYNALCESEYDRFEKNIKKELERMAKERNYPSGLDYYRHFRPQYYIRGLMTPPNKIWVVLNAIKPYTFLPRLDRQQQPIKSTGLTISEGVAKVMVEKLKRAEEIIRSKGWEDEIRQQVHSIIGFQPREMAGAKNIPGQLPKMSYHALGQAIDIDARDNPQLIGPLATAIDNILDWLDAQKQQQPPEGGQQTPGEKKSEPIRIHQFIQTFKKSKIEALKQLETDDKEAGETLLLDAAQKLRTGMEQIEQAIQGFINAWLEQWQASGGKAKEDDKERQTTQQAFDLLYQFLLARGVIPRDKKTGKGKLVKGDAGKIVLTPEQVEKAKHFPVISLPATLIVALVEAGLRSGLEYRESKDVMHFESL